MKAIFKILLVVIALHNCSSKQKGIENMIREWQGKEIIIPQQIEYKLLGCDTVCSDLWDMPYKILTYVDSVGCTICKMGLSQWQELIELCERHQLNVAFLFVIHSSDYNLLSNDLIAFEFNYPVIYDEHNLFDKLNRFPPVPYRTFLLDKDNKVQLVGSPIENPKIWELYKKVITKSQK